MNVLINLIVVVISQYVGILTHHILHLKLSDVLCQLSLNKVEKITDGVLFQ